MPSVFNTSTRLSANPHIALDGVTLLRGNTTVFQSLALKLSEPRIGIIGDNGAGKSSLFRLICGLDQPQTGQVHLPPPEVDSTAPVVGMMFQNPDEQIIFPPWKKSWL